MSITTLDGLIAGMQPSQEIIKATGPTMAIGRMYSFFYVNGMPAAAAAPTPGLAGEALTSYAGQIPFANPASGYAYLARFAAQCTVAGQLLLCDRLWHNSNITITSNTPQTINSVAFPARDNAATTDGVGVLLGVEVSTQTGSGTPTLTVGYTNAAGADTRTATNLINTAASSVVGTFYPIGLMEADTGVRSVQSLMLSSTWTSGVIHLVAYRVLARLDLGLANMPYSIDAITGGMPRAWANTVPFLIFVPSATTASIINGHLVWSHG